MRHIQVLFMRELAFFRAGDITEELVDSFFEAEVEMERKICRDMVCTSRKDEEGRRASDGLFTPR